MSATSTPAETDAPGFAPFQREDATHDGVLRAGRRRLSSKRRGDLAMEYRGVRSARPAVRRAHPDPAQRRRARRSACASFRSSISRSRRARTRASARSATRRSARRSSFRTAQRLRARLRLRRDQPRRACDRDDADALLRRPGARHPYARDGRDRRARRRRPRDDGRRVAAFCRRRRASARRRGADRHRVRTGQEPRRGARGGGDGFRSPRPRPTSPRPAPPGPSGSARSRSAPTGRISTGWSTPGCPISSTPRGSGAASGRTSAAARPAIATSFRTCLPLALLEPRLARAQIVLHASQQFREGDVLKWWHRAPNGGTGLGQRTKASDPHLWLPYVLARYVREHGRRERARRGDALPRRRGGAGQRGDLDRHPARLARDRHGLRARAARHRLHPRAPRRERPAAAQGRRLERRHRRARPPRDRHQRLDGLLPRQRARRLHPARRGEGRRGFRRASARRRSRASARRSRSAGGAIITCSTSPTTARFSISRTR